MPSTIVDALPVAALTADRNGVIRHANIYAAQMMGYDANELPGLSIDVLIPEERRDHHRTMLKGFFTADTPRKMKSGREFCVCRKDGSTFTADISLTTIDKDGETLGLACLIDLTPHHTHKIDLARSNRALRLLSSSNRTLLRAGEVQSLFDDVCNLAVTDGGYLLAWIGHAEQNPKKSICVQAKAGPAIGYLDHISITWDDTPLGRGPTGTSIRTGKTASTRFVKTDPTFTPWRQAALAFGIQSSISLPLHVGGKMFGSLTLYASEPDAFDAEEQLLLEEVASDLAFGIETIQIREAQKKAESELITLAYNDFVTGLPNRASVLATLDAMFACGTSGAFLFIDLSRFKELNDAYGYLAGDEVLCKVAQRIGSALQKGEILARIGGNEFAVIAPGAGRTEAGSIALQLMSALREPPIFVETAGTIVLSAKIGIALYPEGRASPNELFADAGLACRHSDGSSDQFSFHSPRMTADLTSRMIMSRDLELSITQGGLQLYYQPKVNMLTGEICGAEALLRWNCHQNGPIGPHIFIPIAEERGLMPKLGAWVLHEATRQMSAWKHQGLRFPGKLAVNVSTKQLDDLYFITNLDSIVQSSDCSASDFELEITESALATDGPSAVALLHEMNALGFDLDIDDFGTGFSSLAYLSKFPARTLKIDISFVRNMMNSANDHAIVETIIAMARSLGLNTVAEGVETEEQAKALIDLGCHVAQGYLYSRPIPADEFARCWMGAGAP